MFILKISKNSKGLLAFLLGSDAVASLPAWKEPRRLVNVCQFVVFSRPGFPLLDLEALDAAVPGISGRVTFVEVSQLDISGSDIRRRVARGDSIGQLVPPSVEKYILEHGLYREG